MANLLLGAERRKRITAEKRRELAIAASALRVKVDREPVSVAAIDELASRHALTAYDATYLELALRRRLPLATQDRVLRIATGSAGVALR